MTGERPAAWRTRAGCRADLARRLRKLLAALVFCAGCAAAPVASIPQYSSDEIPECDQRCDLEYEDCWLSCDAIAGAYEQSECVNVCEEARSDCHASCVAAD